MFERVAEVFRGQQAKGRFPGGQLVIRHKGREVLSVAVGVARGFRETEGVAPIAVTAQTRFSVFSASKAVVALAVAMLEDRGVLDVAAPVAQYVPDFAANGKGELTVLDVLTHRAGVFTPEPSRLAARRPGARCARRRDAALAERNARVSAVRVRVDSGRGLSRGVGPATRRLRARGDCSSRQAARASLRSDARRTSIARAHVLVGHWLGDGGGARPDADVRARQQPA